MLTTHFPVVFSWQQHCTYPDGSNSAVLLAGEHYRKINMSCQYEEYSEIEFVH